MKNWVKTKSDLFSVSLTATRCHTTALLATLSTLAPIGGAAVALSSCQDGTEPAPAPVEQVDNSIEIKEASGVAIQGFIVPPIYITIPSSTSEVGTRSVMKDQNGEAYVLGYDLDVKIPSSMDLKEYDSYSFRMDVLQPDNSYKTLAEIPVNDLKLLTNPDLNKDGKLQNNEKLTQLRGKAALGSKAIWDKVSLLGPNISKREIVDINNQPTWNWVLRPASIDYVKSNGKMKCFIVGNKSSNVVAITPVDLQIN